MSFRKNPEKHEPNELVRVLLTGMVCLATVAVFLGRDLCAQGTAGAIQGTITDASGAVIPGAAVTARNVGTALERAVSSNTAGFYVISNLPPGTYRVQVTSAGFQTSVRESVALAVAQQLVLNVSLAVGEITQQVTVVGEVAELLTTTSEISGNVTPAQVADLPLLGRDFRDLMSLVPGVTPIPAGYTQGGATATGGIRSFRVSIGGGRSTQSAYYIDGLYVNDVSGYAPAGVGGGQLGVDLVREFRVLTNSYSAEYGRAGFGLVNMVSNSGTNSFHGAVSEYFRNDKLNARNFFNNDKPAMRRNQFGAAAGGPIQKEKMFFFTTWESFRGRDADSKRVVVPDLNTRRGLLPDAQGNLVEVPIQIDRKAFDGVMNLYPLPNGPSFGDGSAVSFVAAAIKQRDDFGSVRVDRNLNGKHTLFVRYTINDGEASLPRPSGTFEQALTKRTTWATVQEDWIVNPTLVNTFRVGLSRSLLGSIERPSPGTTVDPSIVIPGRLDAPFFEIGTLTQNGQVEVSTRSPEAFNVYQYSDDIVYNQGNHTVKAGFRAERHQRNLPRRPVSPIGAAVRSGRWRYPTIRDFFANTGVELRDTVGVTGDQGGNRQTMLAAYIHDDFRVLQNLTLNLGFRLEKMTDPTFPGFGISQLEPLFSASHFGFVDYLYRNSAVMSPRIGLAWTPLKSDDTFAVRAGFGIFYDEMGRGFNSNAFTLNDPYGGAQSVLRGVPFPDPYPGGVVPIDASFTARWEYSRYYDVPTSYQWNLSLAKGLRETQVTAAYAGTMGRHLIGTSQVNTYPRSIVNGRVFFDRSGGNRTLRNPNYLNDIFLNTTEGNSYYHSLQLSVSRQLGGGSNVQGAYTFSKCMDLVSGDNTSDFAGLLEKFYYDPYDMRGSRGLCNMDIRNRLAVNGTYQLPFGNLQGIAKALLNGWSISSIFQVSNGAPLTPKVTFPRSNNKLGATTGNYRAERPDYAPGVTKATILGGPDEYFDRNAYVLQPAGFIGLVGRNTIEGPGLATVDLSVVRTFPLPREGMTVQFRSEFFNIFNRVNFGLPTPDLFTSANGVVNRSAGTILNTSTDSRQIQFALKLLF